MTKKPQERKAAAADAPTRDTKRLNWWEKHLNYEHGTDYETGEVILYRVSGNVNDREWDQVACGSSLRRTLDAAMKRGEPE